MSRTVNFIALTFSEGLNVLIGFLFLPYLARAMNINDYGSYGQTLMIVTFVHGLFSLGLGKVIFAYLANQKYKQGNSLISNLIAGFISGIIAAILIFTIAPIIADHFNNPQIVKLLRIYAWSSPFLIMATTTNASLIFFNRVKTSAFITVIVNMIKICLVVVSVQIFSSLEYIFISLFFVAVLKFIMYLTFIPDQIKKQFGWNKKLVSAQIKSGWPLGIASILGVAFWSTDGYMVSVMLDVKEYAIYRNGAFQIPFISSIYGSITAILLPDVSKYFFEGKYEEIVRLKKKVIINTAMLIFPVIVFCIIFAKPLIIVYLSEKYMASYPIFMVYNLMLLARFTSYDDLYIATNNNHKMPGIYIIALLLNIVLNYFFISYMGAIGAAIGSVISFYVLIWLLFSRGVQFLKKKPIDFIDLPKLLSGLLLSIAISSVFFIASRFIEITSISFIIIFGLHILFSYHLIIKYSLVDHSIILNLAQKLGKNNIVLEIFKKYYAKH